MHHGTGGGAPFGPGKKVDLVDREQEPTVWEEVANKVSDLADAMEEFNSNLQHLVKHVTSWTEALTGFVGED